MIALFADLPLVFAQDAANGSFWSTLVLLLPIPFLFYFLFILPQQQQEKKRRAMIDALKKNDKVLTTGGIYGTVISVDANHDKVVLRVDDERGVKLAFTRASVARVLETSSDKSGGSRLMPPDVDRAEWRHASTLIDRINRLAEALRARPRPRPRESAGPGTPGWRNDHETVRLEDSR